MRRLGSVALVCVGLLVIVDALGMLQRVLLSWGYADGPADAARLSLLGLLPALVVGWLGVWLVRRRHVLAERWFNDSAVENGIEPQTLLQLALLVAGVVIVARALAGLVGAIATSVSWSTTEYDGVGETHVSWDWYGLLFCVYPLAYGVVGGLLVVFSRRLAGRLFPSDGPPVPRSVEPGDPVCPSCGAAYDPKDYRDDALEKVCDACGGLL